MFILDSDKDQRNFYFRIRLRSNVIPPLEAPNQGEALDTLTWSMFLVSATWSMFLVSATWSMFLVSAVYHLWRTLIDYLKKLLTIQWGVTSHQMRSPFAP